MAANHVSAPWTAENDAVLHARYISHGAKACAAELGRSFYSVARRAQRLKLGRHRRWSRADDDRLMVLWGVHPIPAIAKQMKRTDAAIYWRAQLLELGLGCPQGHEYLSRAASRTGYSTSSLRLILRWGGVRIQRATTRPGRKPKSAHLCHVVEPTDVDEAVARWCASESLESAAISRGIGSVVLVRLLREAVERGDDRVPAKPERRKKQWRLPTVLVDELVDAYKRRESLRTATLRVGVDRRTLSIWLSRAGIGISKVAKLDPDDVDRVVAERLADPRCKVPRRAA